MKKLWHNGIIYTMEREGETVEAVLTERGKIIALGTFEELSGQATTYIDLEGAVMYPGFVDSHLHMIAVGQQLKRLDLSTITSKEEMLNLLSDASLNLQQDEWLIAEGFNENLFNTPVFPSIEELDAVTNNPLIISRVCRHVYLANSTALKLAKLEAYIDSDKGSVGRNADGQLTGVVYEGAAAQLREAQLTMDDEASVRELKSALNSTIDLMLSKGLTAGHTEDMNYYGPYENAYRTYAEVTAERKDFRSHLLIHHEVFERMLEKPIEFNKEFMELGAMKIFADGSFGGSTAALLEDYTDKAGWKGTLIQSDAEVESLFIQARKYGKAVAVHTIGDRALAQIIQAIEKYPPQEGIRDRIIHGCLLNTALLNRLKKLQIVVDVQPLFVTSDYTWVKERLGDQRLKFAYAWKSLLDYKITCAGSSDGPIENIDPLLGIYAAVTREKDGQVFDASQRVSRYEAIQMYTLGGAMAIGAEGYRGYIKIGYDADFTVFDRDLFFGDLRKAKVAMTVVADNIAYKAIKN